VVCLFSVAARDFTEDVYRLDLRGAFAKKDDTEARELTCKRLGAGAAFLRDLAFTAWAEQLLRRRSFYFDQLIP
jgi:hypothetical protein